MVRENSSRIPLVEKRSQVPDESQHQYDAIEESRGDVRGPFRVLLHAPELAGRVAHLGAYLRYESTLSDRERELTILTTARELNCAFEWVAHEPIAREAGLHEIIDVVVAQRPVDGLSNPEALVVRYVRELLGEDRVSEETFQDIANHFSTQRIIELTATVGYYSMIGCVLNAFEVMPDETAPWPS